MLYKDIKQRTALGILYTYTSRKRVTWKAAETCLQAYKSHISSVHKTTA